MQSPALILPPNMDTPSVVQEEEESNVVVLEQEEREREREDVNAKITEVKDYTIGEIIGEGRFANVFKGKHKVTGQDVAIKIINNNGKDFSWEVDIHRSLRHESIVKILGWFFLFFSLF